MFDMTATIDLVDAVREVLRQSNEPLTIAKIRARLPWSRLEDLKAAIARQVAASVLVMCPKYRGSQDRYWDRPLRQHARVVLHATLEAGPMAWAHLHKKFPKYMRYLAESVLNEELARGLIYRHPSTSSRMGPRYALQPADVRDYAGKELDAVLTRLEQFGFTRADSREALVQLLQADEWADVAATRPVNTSLPVREDWWEKTMS